MASSPPRRPGRASRALTITSAAIGRSQGVSKSAPVQAETIASIRYPENPARQAGAFTGALNHAMIFGIVLAEAHFHARLGRHRQTFQTQLPLAIKRELDRLRIVQGPWRQIDQVHVFGFH